MYIYISIHATNIYMYTLFVNLSLLLYIHTLISCYLRYKEVITEITSSKESCVKFLQEHNVIPTSMKCPGPLHIGKCMNNCRHPMQLEKK